MTANIKTLKVNMFNKFKISDGNVTLTYEDIRSDKVIKLLVYLIMHRNYTIPSQEITDVLWQNEEIDNPVGALKNLVYRLRTLIKKTFDIENCIITGRRAYSWNPEILVETDVERFDELVEKIKQDNDVGNKLKYYYEAVSLYTGPFIPKLSNEHWLLSTVSYYHSAYLSLVKAYCNLLDEQKFYSEMEDASKKAIEIDALDEELHFLFIKALIGQGKQKIAIDHYKATTKMLYESLGTRPSEDMQELYNTLQKIQHDQEMDLNIIQKDLEEEVTCGAYICEYGTFKDIYRLQARMAGRLGISVYISLITLIPQQQASKEQYLKMVSKSMKNMEDILRQSLRVGDIVARYSNNQYVVLLPTCTFEDATHVMQRLLNKFYIGTKNRKIDVHYNLQELILTDSRYK